MTSTWRRLLVPLVCSAFFAAAAGAQQTGTIAGRITDRASGTPVNDANVTIVGTQRGARSADNGAYRITNVPVGTYTVRVSRLGYSAVTRAVTVSGAGETTANFDLAVTAATIDQVVVTATGATERKRENGNDVGLVKPGERVDLAATPTLTSVLTGKTAGLTITQSAGTPGTSSRIRIRGANSISLSNEPLLIIDGVRIENSTNALFIGVGGQTISRFDDISPEEIESIEVLKGPAASALYGTAAANGVLQITTKRGRAGRTSWRSYADYGKLWDPTVYPSNYYVMGTQLTGSNAGKLYGSSCTMFRAGNGLCRPDSTFSFSPLAHYGVMGNGNQVDYGLSASGGGDVAQYYISGDVQKVAGIVTPNKTHNVSLRANISAQLKPNLNATFTSNYIDRLVGLPINDNNIYGVVPNAVLGKAFNCAPPKDMPTLPAPCKGDTISRGFYSAIPSTFYFMSNTQYVKRFLGGANVTWQPLSWLTGVGQAGLDLDNALDQSITPSNVVTYINSSLTQGSVTEYRRQNPTYSSSATFTANKGLGGLQTSTSAGMAYTNEQAHYTYGFGAQLIPGTYSLNGATQRFNATESNQTVVTLGSYAREQLAWRDRLFLTGSIRADRNSAFGTQVTWAYYPSASLSWVVTDEPALRDRFVPSWLTQFRLRAAYGQSGQRPSFRQAETYYSSTSVAQGSSEVGAVVIGGTGSTELKPEISIEDEQGFDASFLDGRLGVVYTHYHKITRDALIAAVLAPSLGVSSSQYVNLGKVKNWGDELTVNATPIDTRGIKLDLAVAGSTPKNKLVNLGGQPPIVFGVQRHVEGYPLGGYFQPKFTYNDANKNHRIEASEITFGDTSTAASQYIGPVLPTKELSITPTLTLKALRIAGLFQYRGGNYLYNNTEEFRCTTSSFSNCRSVSDSTAPLAAQAAAMGFLVSNSSNYGYVEKADFWKLRELSATLSLPASIARRAGASGASLTLAGRNLKTWTNYTGFDPEVITSSANFTTTDFLSQPPLRSYVVRFDVSF